MRSYGRRRRSERLEAEEKKLLNNALIESLGLPIEREKSMLSIKVSGRRIDLWPGSDVWYSHKTSQYGWGIEKLVSRIRSELGIHSRPMKTFIEASLAPDL